MTNQTPTIIKTILIFIVLLSSTNMAFAHGDLEARIKKKSVQISQTPNNSKLYYQRGFLYQQHKEYKNAIKDYNKSEELGNTDKLLYYRRGETYMLIGNTNEALLDVDSYFKINSTDIKIYKLKSSILTQKGEFEKALISHNYFLKNTIDLRPQDFIEHSSIILNINSANYIDAINIINLGLEKLGENTTILLIKKLEYLKANGQFEKVLELHDHFILKNNRKEFWYYKKAHFLYTQERYQESHIALQQAKLAIQRLSSKYRNTSKILKLTKEINLLTKTLKK